jgi:hypothetical protein
VLRTYPVAQIRRADGAVLDAVAQPLARKLALGADQGVQRLLDGAIADGMDGTLETLSVCTPEEMVEPLLVPIEDAAVLAIRGIGLARRRGGPARRPIGHHFEGAEPEPLVTEAAPHPSAEHAHHRVGEAIDGRKGVNSELQAPGLNEVLAGAEGVADEAASVMNTRTASSERPRSAISRVPGPARARMSAVLATARMRPPQTATASTISFVALTVWTRPPVKMSSAGVLPFVLSGACIG